MNIGTHASTHTATLPGAHARRYAATSPGTRARRRTVTSSGAHARRRTAIGLLQVLLLACILPALHGGALAQLRSPSTVPQ